MKHRPGSILAAAALVFGVACGSLPELERGVCGNGVIEAGENCDGFSIEGTPCRSAGALLACQLDCSERDDGTRTPCPKGFGCATDDVCRRASGGYRMAPETTPGDARSLLAGDFDGDGRGDVVALGSPAAFGATKLRVHYFDRNGALERTWSMPRALVSLVPAQVSDDARDDLVFAETRAGVLLGQANRRLISETYPTYFLARSKVQIAGPLLDGLVEQGTALLLFSERDGALILLRPDEEGENLLEIGRFEGRLADLAGQPALARVFEDDTADPCHDLAFALRGASELTLYSVCERDPDTDEVRWREKPRLTRVALDPPAAIEAGPLLADVDGDSHMDVLLAAEGKLRVARGDGARMSAAVPVVLEVDGEAQEELTLPLAAGDFTGDGAADLVYPPGFLLSQRAPGVEQVTYRSASGRFGSAWTLARIADLNGNGKPDVIAASNVSADIDFFNGTGSDRLTPFIIPSSRPVDQLAIGEVDGDLIDDLVFAQTGVMTESDVSVAFGSAAGAPTNVVTVARVPEILQVGTLPHVGIDAAGEFFLAYQQPDDAGESGSAVAWFVGDGDRGVVCTIELTNFAADGSLRSLPALGVAVGAFSAQDRRDALLLGSALTSEAAELWLVPDLRSRKGRPQPLGWSFAAEFAPVTPLGSPRGEPRVELRMAAGDIDGDGLDELMIAGPDTSFSHCLVASARLNDGALVAEPPIAIEPACSRESQLAVADLDGDRAAELILLTGPEAGPRRLLVLWNDGAGRFSDDASSVLAEADAPRAFAAFRLTPDAPVAIAWVTEHGVRLMRVRPGERSFEPEPRELEIALDQGTGITATDIDGDGVTDLVVADAGGLRVLRAELTP